MDIKIDGPEPSVCRMLGKDLAAVAFCVFHNTLVVAKPFSISSYPDGTTPARMIESAFGYFHEGMCIVFDDTVYLHMRRDVIRNPMTSWEGTREELASHLAERLNAHRFEPLARISYRGEGFYHLLSHSKDPEHQGKLLTPG